MREREREKVRKGEWNGDKVVADGAALSALEDDHRRKGMAHPSNGRNSLDASSIMSFCLVPFIYTLVFHFNHLLFNHTTQNKSKLRCCHLQIGSL